MRSGLPLRAFLLLLALMAIGVAPAAAAEPTVYELPAATHAGSLAAGANGTVWFEPTHGNKWVGTGDATIGRLAAGGTITELSAAGFGRPVLGPDGELWASKTSKTAAGEPVIRAARLSSAGTIQQKHTVARGGGIEWMAAARGALWFAHFTPHGRETIGRLSAADGSVRHVLVLGPHCQSLGIAVAPNGMVWFSEECDRPTPEGWEEGPSTINRIATDGKVTHWRLKVGGFPIPIVFGSQGTTWFGAPGPLGGGEVGRITNVGDLAEYPVHNGYPSSIAVGPEGRLWFPSTFGGQVYRALDSISAGGRPGKPVCADPTCELEPISITAAPDGSLWYGLRMPPSIGGGGFTQIMEGEAIANEAGFIGHLVP
jgi:streptogramin lyase